MEVPKEKVPKEKVPEDEVQKAETQKGESPKEGVQKEKLREKYWWVGYVVGPLIGGVAVILAALIGILPQMITKERPHIEPPPLSPQLKELYDQTLSSWRDGAYNEALKELEKLISVRPDYVDAYIIRGRIYLENLQQYQNALEDFRQVLKIEPDNKYALYNLGLTYYDLGDLGPAIEWNQKALDQDPNLIIAIYNHAIYHVDYGQKYKDDNYYDKAIELYENVIARDREFATWAMFNLAALYARLAKEEKSESIRDEYVKKAVELLDRTIEKEGPERLKKVTGEIDVPYGEDLKAIYQDPDYKRMIEKWKDHLRH